MGYSSWPLFDLRIRTTRLEIRLASDEDLDALARVARKGVHDPKMMPFMKPWTDQPSPLLERGLVQWGWRHRAEWSPQNWTFNGAVLCNGVLVGVQDLSGEDFSSLRSVSSGSWLGLEHQGQGIGKEMRRAMLHFAFEGLGAMEANSGSFVDNTASMNVSRSVGYEENGRETTLRRGVPAETVKFRLERSKWEMTERIDVEIEGLDDCLELFVAPPDAATSLH
ncbi:MAG TPA: GNAT family protein [Acidimicrobiales bacterium]|nr:GNAT family protein [Acidimicrobiales bacterium]